jgi:hypothetical protein
MKESLEKLIKRLILPKYPWIKDFTVTLNKDNGLSFYAVRYYIDDDMYDENYLYDEFNRMKINHIKSETKNLYSVLGPSQYDWFHGSSFHSYKRRDELEGLYN